MVVGLSKVLGKKEMSIKKGGIISRSSICLSKLSPMLRISKLSRQGVGRGLREAKASAAARPSQLRNVSSVKSNLASAGGVVETGEHMVNGLLQVRSVEG